MEKDIEFELRKEIGLRIRQRRMELNITQQQIQAITSISTGNLSCIENGKYFPSATALLELSKTLHCSIDWILTGVINNSLFSTSTELSSIEEINLLNGFRALSINDKEEFIGILDLKLKLAKKICFTP